MDTVAFLLVAVVEYNPASTTAQCNQVYLLRNNQNGGRTCAEQTNLAECLARVSLYLNRPLTIHDVDTFKSLIASTLVDPILECQLDIFVVVNNLIIQIVVQINVILSTEGTQPAVGTPYECLHIYFGVIIRTTIGCSIIQDYIACLLLAMGADINTYTPADLVDLQALLNLLLSPYLKDCPIDLTSIINVLRTTPTTPATITTPITTTTDTTTTTPTTTVIPINTSTLTATTTDTTTTTPTTTIQPTTPFRLPEYDQANTTAQCYQEYLLRTFQDSVRTCDEQRNFLDCLARVNLYFVRPLTFNAVETFESLIASSLGNPLPSCVKYVDVIVQLAILRIVSHISVILPKEEKDQEKTANCQGVYFEPIVRTTIGCSIIQNYIACCLLALRVDINTYSPADVVDKSKSTRINFELSLYLKDCPIDLTILISGLGSMPTTPTTLPGCLTNKFYKNACQNQQNGDHPLCFADCVAGSYITCSNNITYEKQCAKAFYGTGSNRKPEQMVFDPELGRCERSTTACPRIQDNYISS